MPMLLRLSSHGYLSPTPDGEAGDSDLSLLSYLDCCENAFREYVKRVEGADYRNTFNLLSFHTPFGGMVKGAHRQMMKKFSDAKAKEIEEDFKLRVEPSMVYCQRVGNIMGATALFSLLSAIDNAEIDRHNALACFHMVLVVARNLSAVFLMSNHKNS